MNKLQQYIKSSLLKSVGKKKDQQIILTATGWLDRQVLTEEDLAEIKTVIDAKNEALETTT